MVKNILDPDYPNTYNSIRTTLWGSVKNVTEIQQKLNEDPNYPLFGPKYLLLSLVAMCLKLSILGGMYPKHWLEDPLYMVLYTSLYRVSQNSEYLLGDACKKGSSYWSMLGSSYL